MDDQPNPYESPQTENLQVVVPSQRAGEGDGWKFALLAGAVLLGLLSLFPWIGAIFAVASAPVFLRYYVMSRTRLNGQRQTPGTIMAAATGTIGIAIGIAGASAGTFFGVCSATAWTTGLALTAILQKHYERGIVGALICGTLAGVVMFVVVILWLPRRIWPHSASRE